MKNTLKLFYLLITPTFMIACNAQSFSSESEQNDEEAITMTESSKVGNNANATKDIVLYMNAHDLSGLEKSSKADAYYYRVLIEELPNERFLVQDFFYLRR